METIKAETKEETIALQSRWDNATEGFQAEILSISQDTSQSLTETLSRWFIYSDWCTIYDQSPTLPEFRMQQEAVLA